MALVVLGVGGASCGGSSSGSPASNDTGPGGTDTPGTDTPTDGPKPDVTHDGPGTDAPVDGGSKIDSTLLTEGKFYMLDDNNGDGRGTISDDGYVAVLDASAVPNKLVAVPLAGGAAVQIVDKGDYVYPEGNFLVVYSSVASTGSAPTFIGTLGVWSKAGGYHQLSTASRVGHYAMSGDHNLIMFTDKESTKLADVVISDLAGTAKHTIVAAAKNDLSGASCSPQFIGTPTKVAAILCDTPTASDAGVDGGDAGATGSTATLSVYDGTGTGSQLVASIVPNISGSKTGDKIWTLTRTGDATVYASDGSGSTAIDTGVLFGRITDDGAKAIYSKPSAAGATSGPLYAATVGSSPSPAKITDDTVQVFFNYAQLGSKYVEYGTSYDPTNRVSDLKLAQIGGGAAISVSTDPASIVFGDPISADQKYAIFYTNVSAGAGDIETIDITAAGAKATIQANNTWVSYSPKGSLVIYNDNWGTGGNGSEGVADIRLVDAGSGTRNYIAIQAENNFYISPDKTKVIFSTNDPSFAKGGLYTATFP
jgi:hypothetical protein